MAQNELWIVNAYVLVILTKRDEQGMLKHTDFSFYRAVQILLVTALNSTTKMVRRKPLERGPIQTPPFLRQDTSC